MKAENSRTLHGEASRHTLRYPFLISAGVTSASCVCGNISSSSHVVLSRTTSPFCFILCISFLTPNSLHISIPLYISFSLPSLPFLLSLVASKMKSANQLSLHNQLMGDILRHQRYFKARRSAVAEEVRGREMEGSPWPHQAPGGPRLDFNYWVAP